MFLLRIALRHLCRFETIESPRHPGCEFIALRRRAGGLHILGGLVVLGVAADHAWRSDDPVSMRRAARLCAIYWHFLLVVWAGLFALMLADNSGAIHIIDLVSHHASQLFTVDPSRF